MKVYIISFVAISMLVSCVKNKPNNSDVNIQSIEEEVETKKEDSIALIIDTAKLAEPDIDYEFVKIGKQYWMTKNLDVSVFRNGDTIFHAATKQEWQNATKEQKPAWCYYNNDSTYSNCCGKLYNWYAVNDPRRLAPKGWRIPNKKELEKLLSHVGGWNVGKLMNTEAWNYEEADNKSGFNAYPCGGRFWEAEFNLMGENTEFWSTEVDNHKIDDEERSFALWLNFMLHIVTSYPHQYGFSVRCIRE